MHHAQRRLPDAATVPRAVGTALLSARTRDGQSVLGTFRTSGSLKVLFPVVPPRLEAIIVNTAGGLTGGDRLHLAARVEDGAHLCLTTQAAERAYRAGAGEARVSTELIAADRAHLAWLPQELILYDGAALRRRLRVSLSTTSTLLLVEPVIFGRLAMGECLRAGCFHDRIEVARGGDPLWIDGVDLSGDIAARLARPAIARGAGAMASLLYVASDAEAHRDAIRRELPDTAGATLLGADVLAVRLLATDGFELRRHLVPILDRLSNDTLPTSWRL